MTKKVRIENADNSAHKVTVETWMKGANGEPDTLKDSREINSPTDLAECWVWAEQYLVVKETA